MATTNPNATDPGFVIDPGPAPKVVPTNPRTPTVTGRAPGTGPSAVVIAPEGKPVSFVVNASDPG